MMRSPVLVTPATVLPVSLVEMKAHLRVDHNDDDTRIESEIRSAVAHYENRTGILGISLSEQTWRQTFDRFQHCMPLLLSPVIDAPAVVKWKNTDGDETTVPPAEFALLRMDDGLSHIRFVSSFVYPSKLYDFGAVTVEYKTGWPVVDGKSTVPEDIKTAIKIRVQMIYDEAPDTNVVNLERVEMALIYKYQRFG